MKLKTLIFTFLFNTIFLSAFGQILPTYYCNNDSIQDLPKMFAGQPYHVQLKPVALVDTVIQNYPLGITLHVAAAENIAITGLPAGFSATIIRGYNIGLGPDSLVSCIEIDAPASAVDAAILASPNGDGVYPLQFTFTGDCYLKNIDPNSGILVNYTWTSTLGFMTLVRPVMLGYNTGGSPCYSYFYNGNSTYYAGLPATAGSYNITAQSNYVNCTLNIISSCNWVTTSVQNTGNGDGIVTVNYTANPLDTPRYCNLTAGNSTYLITQIEPDCQVAMSIDSTTVGPLDGTMYVTVTAADTCYWSILNRDFCDWMDVNPSSGYGTQTVEISYANNNTGQPRSCDLNFSGETVHIEQQATVGLNENVTLTFDLFPNPASDVVTINSAGQGALLIYSVAGQLLQQVQLTSTKQLVSTTGLANGIYIFTLQDAKGNNTHKKVVISR